jgi:hypothetical protein
MREVFWIFQYKKLCTVVASGMTAGNNCLPVVLRSKPEFFMTAFHNLSWFRHNCSNGHTIKLQALQETEVVLYILRIIPDLSTIFPHRC